MAKNSCQKRPNFWEILGTKVVQFWCNTKLVKTKTVPLNWYFSKKFFLERLRWFLTLKIDVEKQILALFDSYFWPINKSHEKIKSIFVIKTIMPPVWNVFFKFCWHDEKLTKGAVLFQKCLYLEPNNNKILCPWRHKITCEISELSLS